MSESKMGRPVMEFDWSKLDAILQYKASLSDTADIMDCSEDTVENRIKEKYGITFSEYRNKKMSKIRISLVQKAINMANNGNVAILIFCLKNLCNWADKQELDVSTQQIKTLKLKYKIE
jgi:hypothetical protein